MRIAQSVWHRAPGPLWNSEPNPQLVGSNANTGQEARATPTAHKKSPPEKKDLAIHASWSVLGCKDVTSANITF